MARRERRRRSRWHCRQQRGRRQKRALLLLLLLLKKKKKGQKKTLPMQQQPQNRSGARAQRQRSQGGEGGKAAPNGSNEQLIDRARIMQNGPFLSTVPARGSTRHTGKRRGEVRGTACVFVLSLERYGPVSFPPPGTLNAK